LPNDRISRCSEVILIYSGPLVVGAASDIIHAGGGTIAAAITTAGTLWGSHRTLLGAQRARHCLNRACRLRNAQATAGPGAPAHKRGYGACLKGACWSAHGGDKTMPSDLAPDFARLFLVV
jgi:hypothetical protein